MKRWKTIGWLIIWGITLVLLGCSSSGSDSDRDIDEPDRVSVSGTVTDINGDPIAGAPVTITATAATAADLPIPATTDSRGVFVALVPPGDYTITIQMAFIDIHFGTFTCEADTPLDLGTIATSYDPVPPSRDDDGDGYTELEGDCDDTDQSVHPGADEICDDGRDNDCDGGIDCDDGDCDGDPACGANGSGDTSLLWILPYDPEVPISRWEYEGGVAVRMVFFQDFRATGTSGRLGLTAAVKETAAAPTALSEERVDVAVTAGRNYTLITSVAVSNWGACNNLDRDAIVFGSPATAETRAFDINAVYNTTWDRFECVGRYAIGEMRIDVAEGAVGSPVPGYWHGTAEFGEVEFRLTADGTAVDSVELDFQAFSCGDVDSASGSITLTSAAGWPVSGDQFSINLTLSHTLDQEMRLAGRFADAGTTASGTYTADFNGSLCEGTWTAAPKSDPD